MMGGFYGVAVAMMLVIVIIVTMASSGTLFFVLTTAPFVNGVLGALGGLIGALVTRSSGARTMALEPAT
jgi:hypothetical protein